MFASGGTLGPGNGRTDKQTGTLDSANYFISFISTADSAIPVDTHLKKKRNCDDRHAFCIRTHTHARNVHSRVFPTFEPWKTVDEANLFFVNCLCLPLFHLLFQQEQQTPVLHFTLPSSISQSQVCTGMIDWGLCKLFICRTTDDDGLWITRRCMMFHIHSHASSVHLRRPFFHTFYTLDFYFLYLPREQNPFICSYLFTLIRVHPKNMYSFYPFAPMYPIIYYVYILNNTDSFTVRVLLNSSLALINYDLLALPCSGLITMVNGWRALRSSGELLPFLSILSGSIQLENRSRWEAMQCSHSSSVVILASAKHARNHNSSSAFYILHRSEPVKFKYNNAPKTTLSHSVERIQQIWFKFNCLPSMLMGVFKEI